MLTLYGTEQQLSSMIGQPRVKGGLISCWPFESDDAGLEPQSDSRAEVCTPPYRLAYLKVRFVCLPALFPTFA